MTSHTPIAQTERLRLRRMQRCDVDAMRDVYSDPEAMRYVGDGSAISEEDVLRWVDITLANYANKGYGMFVVELRETGQVIGFCGLVHPGGQELPELKYAYLRDHWGNGYATEAGEALRGYGERELGMAGIISTVDAEHTVSQQVLKKCNFTYRKTLLEEGEPPVALWAWGEI